MARLQLVLIAAIFGCYMVGAQYPVSVPGYNCPVECNSNPNCFCATNGVPGGLPASSIPQFIVLTNDDAITVQSMPIITDITDSHRNKKNGCQIPATWFVSIDYTDPNLVQEVYMKNHEIATHTYNHVMNPGVNEIVSAKLWLNITARVPLEKIRGFRAPFLAHSEEQRAILQQNGFLFDSSIPEPYPTGSSPEGSRRVWPYTMDYGLPQRCDLGTGPCNVNESHPGLWEFPMWDIQDDNNVVLTNMDPQGNIYDAYKREFDRNYYGNRSPLGIYIHAAWLMADTQRITQMNDFIRYALNQENVVFATMSQVIDWMKNPVPYSQYEVNKGCKAPTDMWFPSGSFCPKVQCQHGNWNEVTCSCECIGESLDLQPGFCTDSQGACTVPKVYQDSTKTFYCPGKPSGPKPTPPPQVENPGAVSLDPSCGHSLASFVGLGLSGTQDNSALYTEAIKAVDGLCTSCAVADSPSGNYFMIALPEATELSNVYIVTGQDLTGAYVFVGNSSSNGGLTNPACAVNVNINAASPSVVACKGTGSYVTIATATSLTLCDFYTLGPWDAYPDTSNIILPTVTLPPPPPSPPSPPPPPVPSPSPSPSPSSSPEVPAVEIESISPAEEDDDMLPEEVVQEETEDYGFEDMAPAPAPSRKLMM